MDNTTTLVEKLKHVSNFKDLSTNDLREIVGSGQLRRFSAGASIFCEGEPCSGLFVLIHGCIHLYKFGPMGQANIISIIEPVIMINEVAVLDGGFNPVTAIATEDCILWQLSADAFNVLLKKFSQIGTGLLKTLASRNRELMSHCEDLSFRSVLSRTAKLLLIMSRMGSEPINRRLCSVEEMANRIATVPEAISRSLNLIKNRELIIVSRTEIQIKDPDGLAELALLTCDKMLNL